MKTISLLITLAFLISLGPVILAQEIELPDPGLTPDSPFYFLEIIVEEIGTFFTFGDLKKAERHATLAAERLAEAQAMAEKGNPELAEKTLERYGMQLQNSIARAEKAQDTGKNIEKVMTRIGNATSKHLEVLAEVYEKVPEQAKPAVENAIKVSLRGHEKAVEALKSKDALGEVPEVASLPAQVPQAVRERIQVRVQQESEIEKTLESIDASKSLRTLCTEQGGPSEACEQFPPENPKSFEEIEAFCTELGGPSEICTSVEAKCREYGITTPNKCFLLLMMGNVSAVTPSEEQMEGLRMQREAEEERIREEENTTIEYQGGYLGVMSSTINDDIQTARSLSVNYGALIMSIVPNGPAALAGLKKGDIILEFQSERISEDNNLTELIYRSKAGEVANLKILRGGDILTIHIELAERPSD